MKQAMLKNGRIARRGLNRKNKLIREWFLPETPLIEYAIIEDADGVVTHRRNRLPSL